MDTSFIKMLDLKKGSNFIMMVGPPGAGKTKIADDICNQFENFTIVSPDKIREEITGDMRNQGQNDIVFGEVYIRLKTKLDEGFNVIYDATNCRTTYRYKILDVVRGHTEKIICVMSTTPMSECLRRNDERDRFVPEDVIERMYFTLKKHPPVIFEGYDAIVRF